MHFLISFFKADATNYDKLLKPIKSFTSEIINAGAIDDERQYRDFTIDTIIQDIKYNYIDYTYQYYRKDVSAINDIKHGIIRCVGDPFKRFISDPVRILRMIRLQSQLGYDIDKRTFNAAKFNLSLLATINKELIKIEFNKIICGQFISKAFNTMLNLELFDLSIDNQLFMNCLKNVDLLSIKQLERFNKKITYIDDINKKHKTVNLIDAYIILLSSLEIKNIKKDLHFCLTNEEIDQIEWILNHKDIFTRNDLQQYFLEIKNDNFIHNDRLIFLSLIRHIVNIASTLINSSTGKYIYDAFCSKPLFSEQLRITDNDLKQYIGKNNYHKLIDIKEAIIKRLLIINGNNWPYEYNQYMEVVKQGINDVLPNLQININPWPGKIDDYGNYMPHHKAVQYYRVPLNINKLEDLNIYSFEELEEYLLNKKLAQIKK